LKWKKDVFNELLCTFNQKMFLIIKGFQKVNKLMRLHLQGRIKFIQRIIAYILINRQCVFILNEQLQALMEK
jgi:hypothetical protein